MSFKVGRRPWVLMNCSITPAGCVGACTGAGTEADLLGDVSGTGSTSVISSAHVLMRASCSAGVGSPSSPCSDHAGDGYEVSSTT